MSPTRSNPLPRRLCGALLLATSGMQPLAAQQPQAVAADQQFAPAAERARKEGDKVLQRIVLNGAIQRRVGLPPPPPAPTPAPAPSVKAPAAKVARPPLPAANVVHDRAAPVEEKATEALAPIPTLADPPPQPSSADTARQLPEPQPSVLSEAATTASATTATAAQLEVDPPLVLVNPVEADFPMSIMRRQKKGGVTLQFTARVDGSVSDIEVIKTSSSYLNAHAMKAVSQWKFQPLPRPQSASAELSFDLERDLQD